MFDDDYDNDDGLSNEDMFWLLEPDPDEEPLPPTPELTDRDWVVGILLAIVIFSVVCFLAFVGAM